MKVKELIAYLSTQDPEDEIKVQIHDKLYTLEKGTLQ